MKRGRTGKQQDGVAEGDQHGVDDVAQCETDELAADVNADDELRRVDQLDRHACLDPPEHVQRTVHKHRADDCGAGNAKTPGGPVAEHAAGDQDEHVLPCELGEMRDDGDGARKLDGLRELDPERNEHDDHENARAVDDGQLADVALPILADGDHRLETAGNRGKERGDAVEAGEKPEIGVADGAKENHIGEDEHQTDRHLAGAVDHLRRERAADGEAEDDAHEPRQAGRGRDWCPHGEYGETRQHRPEEPRQRQVGVGIKDGADDPEEEREDDERRAFQSCGGKNLPPIQHGFPSSV